MTIKEFNRLVYPAPKEYRPADIIRLREEKLRMSQAAFAFACNAKLSTLQKWESGAQAQKHSRKSAISWLNRSGDSRKVIWPHSAIST